MVVLSEHHRLRLSSSIEETLRRSAPQSDVLAKRTAKLGRPNFIVQHIAPSPSSEKHDFHRSLVRLEVAVAGMHAIAACVL